MGAVNGKPCINYDYYVEYMMKKLILIFLLTIGCNNYKSNINKNTEMGYNICKKLESKVSNILLDCKNNDYIVYCINGIQVEYSFNSFIKECE